jgi:hypothetical protein
MALEWSYYMDIRPAWWADSGQASSYTASVREQLLKIAKVDTGKVLLSALRYWGKWIVITHYDFSEGACNAFVEERTGAARDGHKYGATVKYTPNVFKCSACTTAAPNNAGDLPHEILCHELVHAFRRVSGKRSWSEASGALERYDSNEEFHAIVLTNIFVSDPTNTLKTSLRRDHRDSAPLGADLSTSFSFFESGVNAFDLIQQFCTDHPGLTGAVSKVPAAFNPIAAYYSDPAECQKRSRSAPAVVREVAVWAKAIRDLLPF